MNQDTAQLNTEITNATAAIDAATMTSRRWVDMNRLLTEAKQPGCATCLDMIDELDRVFPLSQGSHRDVSEYVVYFQQLLAFFKDGSSTGLRNPGQFVGLEGHKEEPESVLLREGEYHIELELSRGRGAEHPLTNVMVEVEMGTGTAMQCPELPSFRKCLEGRTTEAANDCEKIQAMERIFRAADGSDYVLHNQHLI